MQKLLSAALGGLGIFASVFTSVTISTSIMSISDTQLDYYQHLMGQ